MKRYGQKRLPIMTSGILIVLVYLSLAISASAGVYQGSVPKDNNSAFWVGFAPQPEPPTYEIMLGFEDASMGFKFAPQPEPPIPFTPFTIGIVNTPTSQGAGPSPFLFLRVQFLDSQGNDVPLSSYSTPPCVGNNGNVCQGLPEGVTPFRIWFDFSLNNINLVDEMRVSMLDVNNDGTPGAVLPLTPVPEPTTILLLGLGLMGLAGARRKFQS